MNKALFITTGFSLLIFISAIGLFVWQRIQPVQPEISTVNSRIKIVTTIFPLADMTRQVGGEYVDVVMLIKPGISEHSAALTPQQVSEVQQAKMLFAIGHGLDTQLVEKITKAQSIPVQTMDKNINLRPFEEAEHEHGSVDPHYWLTVSNAEHMVQTIETTLSEIDPEHAGYYEKNTGSYMQRLALLETELQQQASALTQRNFMAMHDAWGYFAEHYRLNLVATYEPVEGKQPSLADLEQLKKIVKQYGLKTFFTEPQKASTSATTFLQRELGVNIKTLDPVGGQSRVDSYEKLMRYNMQSIIEGQ